MTYGKVVALLGKCISGLSCSHDSIPDRNAMMFILLHGPGNTIHSWRERVGEGAAYSCNHESKGHGCYSQGAERGPQVRPCYMGPSPVT